MAWIVPYSDLTPDQIRAVEFSSESHRLIVGAPGSGKTLVLLHRTARLRERYGVTDDRFKMLVFTNVLKQYIRDGANDLGIPADAISTYDTWCARYFDDYIGGRRPWNTEAKSLDFPRIREMVREHVLSSKPDLYDFIVVDEGQDLDANSFEVLRTVARHVTVAADRKQQLYENGASEDDIASRLGLPRRNVFLVSAFRCSPYIIPLAAAFISDPDESRAFVTQAQLAPGKRETPVLFIASNFDQERQRLGEVARARIVMGERVAILLPQSRQAYGFRKAMREFGLDAEIQGRNEAIDFSNSVPKILTYHSAKGLTFDTVLLPRVVTNSFARPSEAQALRMMFVAITRASRWVYMSTVEGDEPAFLSRTESLVRSGDLVRRSGMGSDPAGPLDNGPHPRTDGLDDMFT